MGLVNELQESAEREDVQTVLRKAKRLSAKLGRKDISDWLDHEQNGYVDVSKVPDYRHIPIAICYNTNGYIPAGYGYLKSGIEELPGLSSLRLKRPMPQPISEIATMISEILADKGLYQTLDPAHQQSIRSRLTCTSPGILKQLTFMAKLDETSVRAIPEHIKNKVLDWACELEQAGILGTDQSFSAEEKKIAQTVVFNISHSTVEQLNNSGSNTKR